MSPKRAGMSEAERQAKAAAALYRSTIASI
jgi:hypothetical protein